MKLFQKISGVWFLRHDVGAYINGVSMYSKQKTCPQTPPWGGLKIFTFTGHHNSNQIKSVYQTL